MEIRGENLLVTKECHISLDEFERLALRQLINQEHLGDKDANCYNDAGTMVSKYPHKETAAYHKAHKFAHQSYIVDLQCEFSGITGQIVNVRVVSP